jgi:UDP-glucose 4-epimerase
MNILLTGGSGFIGKNIVEHFAQRHIIFAPRHAELELLDETQVKGYFQSHDIDIVIHSAVKPGHRNAQDLSHQLYANTRMFFNIVRNKDCFRKMIFIGSGAVYDMRAYRPRMKEDYFDASVPADEHGFSKYIIAKYIEDVDNVVELRVFGIFGKFEDYAIRFISNAICKTLFDLPITIRQNRRFDYLYIDDLMPVLDHFVQAVPTHRAYNVTPDRAVDLFSIAGMIRTISGKHVDIHVREEGMGPEYSGDNSRLRGEMRGLRFTPLEQAIGSLYSWYSDNRHLIDREKLLVDK